MKFMKCLLLLVFSLSANAMNCPDPENSSLKWGEPPSPWEVSPFSEHRPQGEEGVKFVRATILAYGHLGKGVVCRYRMSIGNYDIWIQAPTKIPANTDNNWIEISSGYICNLGFEECNFYVALD
jgi:hypothetical protein